MTSTKVKVRASLDASGAIEFEVDGVKAKDARLKVGKGTGPLSIDFELHDQTGQGLRFGADPLWAAESSPCPPPRGLNTNQLTVTNQSAGTLSITNQNSGASREIRYQLNFLAADGSQAPCDPIIDNGGGSFE